MWTGRGKRPSGRGIRRWRGAAPAPGRQPAFGVSTASTTGRRSMTTLAAAQVVAENDTIAVNDPLAEPPAATDPFDEIDLGSFLDRKSTRLNSSHLGISYAVFCL